MLGRLVGVRNLAGPDLFKMAAANVSDWWVPSFDDVLHLRRCVGTIRNRFRLAGERGEQVKIGCVFRRETADGGTLLELGIADEEAIYLEFLGAPRVRLPNQEGDDLLTAFERFGDDTANVAHAYGRGPSHLASSGRPGNMLAGLHERLERRITRDW
ncbi:MAG: hypothetical protein ACLP19_26105 [Xanthobacteraceae bacterium]